MQPQLTDLDRYFKRVQLHRNVSLTPNYELLTTLIEQHLTHISFENIDPLLGTGVELDIEAITQKLINSERGGYCFEHNKIFLHVLQKLGFKSYSLAARVTLNREHNDINVAKSHRFNCVEIGQRLYLADVGFGLYTPPKPIEIVPKKSSNQSHGGYKLTDCDGGYCLQTYISDQWKELYRFTLQAVQEADFEVANWYLTTHPDSTFQKRLIVSKMTTDGRYSLNNQELNFYPHDSDQEKTTHTLSSAQEVIRCLRDTFGIKVANISHLELKLTKMLFPEQNCQLKGKPSTLRAV